ncbi:MAG: MATE family efflux transporter [Bacillota bacterium]|nr:MATE family efflux transporter [Bacillota bacterium]
MFHRKIIDQIFDIAIPAVMEMFLYTFILIFETMMVGQYGGKIAVSTVGLCTEILYTISNVFIAGGLSVGITSLVARKIGAKQYDQAENYASIGFIVGVIISIIMAYVLFQLSPIVLPLVGASKESSKLGINYMRISSMGFFFNMITNVLCSIVRGYGDTKTPLKIAVIIAGVNLSLDWLLIFPLDYYLKLGIMGAAIGSSVSKIVGFISIAQHFFTKAKIKLKIKYILAVDLHKLRELFELVIPSSLEEAAFSVSKLLSVFMIAYLGTTAFAANEITNTIESVSFMPGLGFSTAATTLVGIKMGERNYKGALKYSYACTFLGTSIMIMCSVVFLNGPYFLTHYFVMEGERQVVRYGAMCLMVAAIEQPFMALAMILEGALKGMGDTKTPFYISFIACCFIRLPLIFYFVCILKASIVYVWWISVLQWCFEGLVIFVLFERRFKQIKERMV